MEITKEAIQKRLEVLRADMVRLRDNMAATDGAIQDCEYWLKQLETVEEQQHAN